MASENVWMCLPMNVRSPYSRVTKKKDRLLDDAGGNVGHIRQEERVGFSGLGLQGSMEQV